MIGYIYKTTNLINNRCYIGKHSASKFHKWYYGSGKLINLAIEKYGKANFKVELITSADTQDELNELEKHYIQLYRSQGYNLYNIADGGEGLSPELASKYAKERWSKTSKEYRQKHFKPAIEAYKARCKAGLIKMKLCEECGSPVNSHKKTCSHYHRIAAKQPKPCKECGGKWGQHFKTCSKYKPKDTSNFVRSQETRAQIARTLAANWQNEDYVNKHSCPECGAKSGNHRSHCTRANQCDECGGKNYSHKKTCSKYKQQKTFICDICGKHITGIGNLKQHKRFKHSL